VWEGRGEERGGKEKPYSVNSPGLRLRRIHAIWPTSRRVEKKERERGGERKAVNLYPQGLRTTGGEGREKRGGEKGGKGEKGACLLVSRHAVPHRPARTVMLMIKWGRERKGRRGGGVVASWAIHSSGAPYPGEINKTRLNPVLLAVTPMSKRGKAKRKEKKGGEGGEGKKRVYSSRRFARSDALHGRSPISTGRGKKV